MRLPIPFDLASRSLMMVAIKRDRKAIKPGEIGPLQRHQSKRVYKLNGLQQLELRGAWRTLRLILQVTSISLWRLIETKSYYQWHLTAEHVFVWTITLAFLKYRKMLWVLWEVSPSFLKIKRKTKEARKAAAKSSEYLYLCRTYVCCRGLLIYQLSRFWVHGCGSLWMYELYEKGADMLPKYLKKATKDIPRDNCFSPETIPGQTRLGIPLNSHHITPGQNN